MTPTISAGIIHIVLSGLIVTVIALTLYMLVYIPVIIFTRPRIGKWAQVVAHFAGGIVLIAAMYIGFR